ncbi:MAG: tyrosine--tRNA ligase [Nanoarchaeota archaeon]|nr:tyrosine--tRNA ligase [Nanoarchaeota archaeon]
MEMQKRIDLIKRNSAEIIGEDRLPELLNKKNPVVYCGYEPSGEIHLGHLVTITKLLDLQKAGFRIKILLADWHAWLNRKGTWEEINEISKMWEQGFKAAGLTDAEYILGSSFQRNMDYIDDVMKISLNTTINRALRSMQQVARDIDSAKVSQVIYPFMQIEDIKALKVDLVQSGIEQRKIHMLGVELLPMLGYKVPVFVHTPLISSIKGPGSKMSSSDPESMISIRDDPDKIKKKINKAYCPEGVKEENPILAIARLIIMPRMDVFEINRPEKFGGDVIFDNYEALENAFVNKEIHPMDLKLAVAKNLIEIMQPIREKLK